MPLDGTLVFDQEAETSDEAYDNAVETLNQLDDAEFESKIEPIGEKI